MAWYEALQDIGFAKGIIKKGKVFEYDGKSEGRPSELTMRKLSDEEVAEAKRLLANRPGAKLGGVGEVLDLAEGRNRVLREVNGELQFGGG
jgi:hypothetical protein